MLGMEKNAEVAPEERRNRAAEEINRVRDQRIDSQAPKKQEELRADIREEEATRAYEKSFLDALELVNKGELRRGSFVHNGRMGTGVLGTGVLAKNGPNGEDIKLDQNSLILSGVPEGVDVFLDKEDKVDPLQDADSPVKYFFRITSSEPNSKIWIAKLVAPYPDQDPVHSPAHSAGFGGAFLGPVDEVVIAKNRKAINQK